MKKFCKRGHDRTLPGALAQKTCRICHNLGVSRRYREKHPLPEQIIPGIISHRYYCKRGHLRSKETVRQSTNGCILCEKLLSKTPERKAYVKEKTRQYRNSVVYKNKSDLYQRSINGLYNTLKAQSRRRGLSVLLTKEEFIIFRLLPCYYCGGKLSPKGYGLDRINNSIGYEAGNILPACGDCNKHRFDTWTVEENKVAVSAVIKLRKENQIVKPNAGQYSKDCK